MSNAQRIYLTEKDYEALDTIVQESPQTRLIAFLEKELARAEVVEESALPENVVSLHSRVRVLEEATMKERELTLVPPSESDSGDGKVSVASPLGAAVIGLAEGQSVEWPMSTGRTLRFRVMKVVSRPEPGVEAA